MISSETLRTIILEDPALIEQLDAPHAAALDRLFESSTLEPLLWDLTRTRNFESRLSDVRLSSWRTASLLASARAQAHEEALLELEEISTSKGIPLRLLPEPQLSFHTYARPELRPINCLDVLVPPGQDHNFQAALKKRRFFELEELVADSPATRRHLCPLERDGVVVRLFTRSTRDERPRPWDRFGDHEKSGPALLLEPEALLLLLAEEMSARRFAHSLRLVRDVHAVVECLQPSWQTLLHLAVESRLELEGLLALSLVNDILGTAVPQGALAELTHRTLLAPSRCRRLLQVARTLVLEYPASPRHVDILGRLLQRAATAKRTAPAQFVA